MARTLLWTDRHSLPMSTRSWVSWIITWYVGRRRAQKGKAVSACCGLLRTGSICLLSVDRHSLPVLGTGAVCPQWPGTMCMHTVTVDRHSLPAVGRHKKRSDFVWPSTDMCLHTLPHLARPTVNDFPPHQDEKVYFVWCVCVHRSRGDWIW